jgi:hypothetical protein
MMNDGPMAGGETGALGNTGAAGDVVVVVVVQLNATVA